VQSYVDGACNQQDKEKFMICDRMISDRPADYSQVALTAGYTCVDECPQDFDVYGTQIGAPVCIERLTKAAAQLLPVCSTKSDCGAAEVCIYMTLSTNGTTIEWDDELDANGYPAASLRCAPQEYETFMLHTAGAATVDDDGELSVVIA
jgi:hypothetical protein